MYTWEQLRNVTGRCVTVTQEERNSSTVKISEKKEKMCGSPYNVIMRMGQQLIKKK